MSSAILYSERDETYLVLWQEIGSTTKAHQIILPFVRHCKRADPSGLNIKKVLDHLKLALSKSGWRTCCGGFLVLTEQCYLCWLRGHKLMCFLCIDFLCILALTEFDLWSSLGNSLTSFEVWSFLLWLNDHLIKVLVSQVWSNCRIPCLDPE